MCLSAHRGGLEADYDVGQKSEQNKLPRSNGPQCPVHMHTVSPPLSLIEYSHFQCAHIHTQTVLHTRPHTYAYILTHLPMHITHDESSIFTYIPSHANVHNSYRSLCIYIHNLNHITITHSHMYTIHSHTFVHSHNTNTHSCTHTHTQVHCCCSHTHVPMRQLICV